ncbi:TPA: hypothetical protein ACG6CR_004752, partial [Escherichia coli]
QKNFSSMICEHILISAYVFLYGAEGFIILFVETELSHAKIILENLRNKMAGLRIQALVSERFSVTDNIGVDEYDFYPDYNLLIEREGVLLRQKSGSKPDRRLSATDDKLLIFRHCHAKPVDPNQV